MSPLDKMTVLAHLYIKGKVQVYKRRFGSLHIVRFLEPPTANRRILTGEPLELIETFEELANISEDTKTRNRYLLQIFIIEIEQIIKKYH